MNDSDIGPSYDTDALAEVPHYDTYYDNDMFNLFTHERYHPELPKSISDTYVIEHNDSNIFFETSNMNLTKG